MKITRRAALGTAAAVGAMTTAVLHAADEDTSTLGKTKNTQFAVNVEMWWTRLPFLQRLEEAAKLGFPAIEMWPWRNRGDKVTVDQVAEKTQQLKLKVIQFTAWGFSPGLNETKNHNMFVEHVDAGCEAAKKLGCNLMCVVAGNDVKGLSQEQMHENVIEGLKRGAPIAEKNGVTLMLEPMNIRVDHKGHCLYGSAPTMKIIKAVGSKNVKVLWDLYHMHITEGDLCGHLREGMAADAIAYIQIADHPGRNEPGTGEIHYPRVLKELKALGYKGWVGLECRPKGSEIDAARAVKKADEW